MAEKKKRKPRTELQKRLISESMLKSYEDRRTKKAKKEAEALGEARRKDYEERKASGRLTPEEQSREQEYQFWKSIEDDFMNELDQRYENERGTKIPGSVP